MSHHNAAPLSVIVIGGGLMGTSCAWQLAQKGAVVTVLEKSVPGAEASSAAAGILGAEAEAHGEGPMLDLCRYSRKLYPSWARKLQKATQVDVGYLQEGCIEVAFSKNELNSWKKKRAFQLKSGHAELLSKKALLSLSPNVTKDACGGLLLPHEASITPKRLFRATHIAAEKAGVKFQTGAYVRRVITDATEGPSPKVQGVLLEDNTLLRADVVVVAAGSWTPLIEGLPLGRRDIIPARGQVIELRCPSPLLLHLAFSGNCYLVPRADGRVVVGSTLEFVGFQKGVTAKGVRELLTSATRLIPALEQAEFSSMWSNFRPYTADELPLLGKCGIDGLILASGHYRTGILLAPATAHIVANLALGRPSPVDLSAFNPVRHQK